MIVQCEKCRAQFKVPDHKVSSQGVKVRCASCQHAFRVQRSSEPTEQLSSGSSPVASSAPLPPSFAAPAASPASDFDDLAFGDDPFAAPARTVSAPTASKGAALLQDVPEETDALFGEMAGPPSEIDFSEVAPHRDRSLFDMPSAPEPAEVPRVESLGALPFAAPSAVGNAPAGRSSGPSEAALKARAALAASAPESDPAPASTAPQPVEARRSVWVELAVSMGVIAFLVLATAALVARGSVQAADQKSAPTDAPSSSFLGSVFSGLLSSPRELAVREVSNGLYETRAGRPLFYVRGEVVNRGNTAGAAVVRAEILDGGLLVRSAESAAGISPTPEELYNLSSGAELDALKERLAAAAKPIRPGEHAAFLIPFDEYPTDPSRFRLRLVVAAP